MDLRFVETFVWVARLQNITRTAETLFLTQSAVSNRIAVLETEVGMALVDRRDRQFRLTPAGEKFLDHAEHLLAIQHRIKRDLGKTSQAPIALRLGVIETVSHTWLIQLMEWLREKNPNIQYELNVEMTPALHQQFRRGGLDLLFSAESVAGKGTKNEKLLPMEMVFVGHKSLAEKGRLSIATILASELITFQRNSQPHQALVQALTGQGAGDKRLHSVSVISAMVKLVESGFGLATLPREAALALAAKHDIALLDTELPLKPLPLFASHLNQPANPELEEIISSALLFARNARRQSLR